MSGKQCSRQPFSKGLQIETSCGFGPGTWVRHLTTLSGDLVLEGRVREEVTMTVKVWLWLGYHESRGAVTDKTSSRVVSCDEPSSNVMRHFCEDFITDRNMNGVWMKHQSDIRRSQILEKDERLQAELDWIMSTKFNKGPRLTACSKVANPQVAAAMGRRIESERVGPYGVTPDPQGVQ
jgi:hypothetical protein